MIRNCPLLHAESLFDNERTNCSPMCSHCGLYPKAGNGAFPLGDSNNKVTLGVCGGRGVVKAAPLG
jgi:hypothetical protein